MSIPSSSMISERIPAAATRVSGAAFVEVDGTLIDSTHERAQAWAETLAELGHEVRFERLWRLVGSGADVLLEVAGLPPEDEHARRMYERYRALFNEKYLPRVRPLPGARALLERLKVDGMRVIALACDGDTKALLDAAGLSSLLECIDEADAPGDALRRAGCERHKALVIASKPFTVRAAQDAGVRAVAVRSGGYSTEALQGAVAVYSDALQLLELLYEVLPRPSRA